MIIIIPNATRCGDYTAFCPSDSFVLPGMLTLLNFCPLKNSPKTFCQRRSSKTVNRNLKHFDVLMCIFTGNSDSIIFPRVFSKKKRKEKKLTFAIIEYTTEIVLQCNYSEPLIE